MAARGAYEFYLHLFHQYLNNNLLLTLFFFLCLLTVPDAPRSFTVSEIYADALRVSWDRPLRLNSTLTAYLVKHWRNDTLPSSGPTTRLTNNTLSHTVTGLRANTAYVVEVYAETRAGTGTSKTLVAKTTESPGKKSC